MEEIELSNDVVNTTDLITRCRQILESSQYLGHVIKGFVPRTQQIELAVAITKAILQQSILVAEAGTGTGKTFAYLIPCLLSGKKALISTATKTLQDQLFQKDLPLLLQALGVPLRIQNLKGRSNYICRYRTILHNEEGRSSQLTTMQDLLYVQEKLPQLIHGERNELPELREDSPVWPYITSTADNCLGYECPEHSKCFLIKARKRALEADLVVINHHLFFADSVLKENGVGEILPGVEVVVFDEAHQLAEIATNFYGERVSTRQCREIMDDLLHELSILESSSQYIQDLSNQLDEAINQLVTNYTAHATRCSWDEIIGNEKFIAGWQKLLTWFDNLQIAIQPLNVKDNLDLYQCGLRLKDLQTIFKSFDVFDKHKIRWLEVFKHTIVFHLTPYDIQQPFQNLLQKQQAAYIFTSATLTMANSFSCFMNSLGFLDVETLALPSPFNFEQQALLYLPRDLLDPNHENYYDNLLIKVIPLIQALKGRCFFLFTSHRALQLVAKKLASQIKYPLLVQGDESKPILLNRFRELGNAVLLGTATFWEGVDVKGQILSCVIIDKLPFASHMDPVTRARMAYIKSCGLSAFNELSLPQAVLALKQGVGRLIRDFNDRGLLVIADPRLTGREYGRTIFASLPAMRKTRDAKKVIDFIDELAD